MNVRVTDVPVEELIILIHENALEEMKKSRARIVRRIAALHEDLNALDRDILLKSNSIKKARAGYLARMETT